MTGQDNLRDRIAHLLHRHFELTAIGPVGCGHDYRSDEEHVAQAIIDEFKLTVEDGTAWEGAPAGPIPVPAVRAVGKWEKQ